LPLSKLLERSVLFCWLTSLYGTIVVVSSVACDVLSCVLLLYASVMLLPSSVAVVLSRLTVLLLSLSVRSLCVSMAVLLLEAPALMV
jgi:hypothetical protein